MTRILLLTLALCCPAASATAPGEVISITATAQIPGGELVTACNRLVVMNPALASCHAPWRTVYYSARPDALLNGCLVRRIVDGVVVDGIQDTDGGLIPLEGG